MTKYHVRIEGEEATLVLDGQDIPPDATLTWTAGAVASMVHAALVSGRSQAADAAEVTIRPFLAAAARAGADGVSHYRSTKKLVERDEAGRVTAIVEVMEP